MFNKGDLVRVRENGNFYVKNKVIPNHGYLAVYVGRREPDKSYISHGEYVVRMLATGQELCLHETQLEKADVQEG